MPCLFRFAAVVSSEFQGRKLYNELVKTRIDKALELGFNTIATRTQNPLVEFTIRKELDMYGISYSVNRELIPGVFGRKLTENFQTCKDELINGEYRKLDLEKGDGYYLTFNLKRHKRDKPKYFGGISL